MIDLPPSYIVKDKLSPPCEVLFSSKDFGGTHSEIAAKTDISRLK